MSRQLEAIKHKLSIIIEDVLPEDKQAILEIKRGKENYICAANSLNTYLNMKGSDYRIYRKLYDFLKTRIDARLSELDKI